MVNGPKNVLLIGGFQKCVFGTFLVIFEIPQSGGHFLGAQALVFFYVFVKSIYHAGMIFFTIFFDTLFVTKS